MYAKRSCSRFVVVLAAFIFFFSAISLSEARDIPKKGVILGSWWYNDYSSTNAAASLDKLAATGANYVGILATWYMDTTTANGEYSTSNVVYRHATKSPTDASLRDIIRKAKAKGMSVMLKLHVRVIINGDPANWDDKWAGNIQPSDPAAWFDSYKVFVHNYAVLCQQEGVELFVFGTEMNSMTKSENSAEWDDIITDIKAAYTGEITFSSNMYLEYTQIPFWARCDYLGIGPYFSLTNSGVQSPTLDQIADGWYNDIYGGNLVQQLSNWQASYNKPVIFTEIGYCSVDTATFEPWKGTQTLAVNLDLQKRAYDALCLILSKQSWFDGLFWWVWETDPGAGTSGLSLKNYTPQNKPAENSIKNFYKGIQDADIASLKIGDGSGAETVNVSVPLGAYQNFYLRAYDSLNNLLGFVSGTWSSNNTTVATLDSASGGVVKLHAVKEGDTVLSAVDSYGNADSTGVVTVGGAINLRVPSQYATITDAIAAAQPGNIILVAPGTYPGNITVNRKNGIKIVSEAGPGATIIEGSNDCFVFDYSSGDSIEGFTIRSAEGRGIYCNASSPTIRNNIIENCRWGISTWASNIKIYNNIIRNNGLGLPAGQGAGVRMDGGAGNAPEIVNNVIAGNKATEGAGIYIANVSAVIKNNVLTDNLGSAIRGWCANWTLAYNDLWNNTYDYTYDSCPAPVNSIALDPLFKDAANGDYSLLTGSPCINAGDPDTAYNDLDGSRNDMGIYGGQFVERWILNMSQMSWCQNTPPYNSTGAATCQMILNYIRDGAGQPQLMQDDIYRYARDPGTYGTELNPAEVSKALGHFDPYDQLVSNWADIYDSNVAGNPYQGYNFSVDTYNPGSDADALKRYMRDICHWMAFSVSKEEWWKNGELVARPNTPAAIPIYGNYGRWVAVRGCVTSQNPCPEVFMTPNFTVYGFWIKDPLVNGIGQDTYKTASECAATYFRPLVTGDVYNGLYVQVAEPPASMSDAIVDIKKPTADPANLEFIGVSPKMSSSSADGLSAVKALNSVPLALKIPQFRKKSWKDMVDSNLLTDPEAVASFEGSLKGSPALVKRLDNAAADYYLVPFYKKIKKSGYLASAVVILDRKSGYFKEASWTKTPGAFLAVDKNKALALIERQVTIKKNKDLQNVPTRPINKYIQMVRSILSEYANTIYSLRRAVPELVWEPNKYSPSPYKPYWRVKCVNKTWFVTQDGAVISN